MKSHPADILTGRDYEKIQKLWAIYTISTYAYMYFLSKEHVQHTWSMAEGKGVHVASSLYTSESLGIKGL